MRYENETTKFVQIQKLETEKKDQCKASIVFKDRNNHIYAIQATYTRFGYTSNGWETYTNLHSFIYKFNTLTLQLELHQKIFTPTAGFMGAAFLNVPGSYNSYNNSFLLLNSVVDSVARIYEWKYMYVLLFFYDLIACLLCVCVCVCVCKLRC